MTDHLAVLTTIGTEEKAHRLAITAVEAGLAACAQIDGPVTSVYFWEGRVEKDIEWRVLYKTTAAAFDALSAHITAEHDYEVPEIIATPITAGGDAYLAWVGREVRG